MSDTNLIEAAIKRMIELHGAEQPLALHVPPSRLLRGMQAINSLSAKDTITIYKNFDLKPGEFHIAPQEAQPTSL